MTITTLTVGPIATNCYLFSNKNKDCFIVDPGDEAEKIIEKIEQLKLKPNTILATHGHFDHVLAVQKLQKKYSIPFYLHKDDLSILKVDKKLKDKDVLKLGEVELKVISTPGHTPGGVVFYCQKEKLAFTGDTVFANGYYGRTDLEGGDARILRQSIKKIFELAKETVLYPGHGASTILKDELK